MALRMVDSTLTSSCRSSRYDVSVPSCEEEDVAKVHARPESPTLERTGEIRITLDLDCTLPPSTMRMLTSIAEKIAPPINQNTANPAVAIVNSWT